MANPHSLPFQSSNTKKRPAQLPLPSSNTAPPVTSPTKSAMNRARPSSMSEESIKNIFPISSAPNSPFSTSPRMHNLPLSIDTARAASPTFSSFQSPTAACTTHAGGIQPSASFFRPSKPTHQPFSPTSALSGSALKSPPPIAPQDGDAFQLSRLGKHSNTSSEENMTSLDDAPSIAEDAQPPANCSPHQLPLNSSKRVKHSREPLLPIGGRVPMSPAAGTSKLPSLARGILDRSVNSGPASASAATSGFRGSIEKVLKRGLSVDSTRRSSSTRANLSLEGRVPDEERGFHTGSTVGTFQNIAPGMHSPRSVSSPMPSFVPVPPGGHPPLAATPVMNPKTGKPLRNYERNKSRNTFFFRGRLLTGGDHPPWAFIGSVLVTLAITGVWFGTTVVWWAQNQSPAIAAVGGYLCLLTISSMFVTVCFSPPQKCLSA
jgi:palmitoyltransferase ZDHHC9/14/18